MLMAENARTGFVWETFMKNPEAQLGMAKAALTAYGAATPNCFEPCGDGLLGGEWADRNRICRWSPDGCARFRFASRAQQ